MVCGMPSTSDLAMWSWNAQLEPNRWTSIGDVLHRQSRAASGAVATSCGALVLPFITILVALDFQSFHYNLMWNTYFCSLWSHLPLRYPGITERGWPFGSHSLDRFHFLKLRGFDVCVNSMCFWITWILQPRGKKPRGQRKIELWGTSEVKKELIDVPSWVGVMLIICLISCFVTVAISSWTSKINLSPMKNGNCPHLANPYVSNHRRFCEQNYISLLLLRSHCWLDLDKCKMNAGPAMFASRTILGLETYIVLPLKILQNKPCLTECILKFGSKSCLGT